MSAAYRSLLAAYGDRLAASRLAAAQREKVVGYVGNTVPVELIAASGCHPVRIAPVTGDPSRADRWIEPISDTDVRLIFADYLAGAYDHCSLLVVPRSTESQHKLYLSLREAWRTGVVTAGPALWLYDILHTQRESSRQYGLARTQALAHQLGTISGQPATEAALRSALLAGNETRCLLQQLQRRRLTHDIPGTQAHTATGALRFVAPADGAAALREWLAEHPRSQGSGPRVMLKGCPLDHAALHAAVEAAGGNVVLEDDEWGSRAAQPSLATDQPPLQALFENVWRDVPCPRLHPAPLDGSWFAQTLASRHFDAVIFNLPTPEDVYGWSFPAERDAVAAAGLPWLLLREDARCSTTLPAQLNAFFAKLRAAH